MLTAFQKLRARVGSFLARWQQVRHGPWRIAFGVGLLSLAFAVWQVAYYRADLRQEMDLAVLIAEVGIVAVAVGIVAALWFFPKWQINAVSEPLSGAERLKAEEEARRTWAQIAVGGILFVGGFHTWLNIQSQNVLGQRKTHIDTAAQLLVAAEKLHSESAEVRVAAVLALERLGALSEDERFQAAEVLAEFVRRRSPWRSGTDVPSTQTKLPSDVQSALRVLMRGKWAREYPPIDLSGTDLRGADLSFARPGRVRLDDAHLDDATFTDASLQGAYLRRASLKRAFLVGTILDGAHLNGADLTGAALTSTSLLGADLSEATGLRPEAIKWLRVNRRTQLPGQPTPQPSPS